MASKTYISLRYLEFYAMLMIDGKPMIIPFVGGTRGPVRRCGIYSTSDTKIQNALEDSPAFGERWDILGSKKRSLAPLVIREVYNEPEDLSGFTLVPGVTSAQKAKDWFIDNYPDINASDLANKGKILAVAKEYNIKFTDWM